MSSNSKSYTTGARPFSFAMRTNSTELLRQELLRARRVLRYLQDAEHYTAFGPDAITASPWVEANAQYDQSEAETTGIDGLEDLAPVAPLIDVSANRHGRMQPQMNDCGRTKRRPSSASETRLIPPAQDVHHTAQSEIVLDLVSAIHSTMSIFRGISDAGPSVYCEFEEGNQDSCYHSVVWSDADKEFSA